VKIESVGILIGLRPLNERDSVAHIFTRDNGVLVGVMRGAQVAKKNKPLVGQVGQVAWNARLDSQLGVFHWEAEKNLAAPLMVSANGLVCMNSAFEILSVLLPERESYKVLYAATLDLLLKLAHGDFSEYLKWELLLLRELGYALDLSCCSGCGTTEDLKYLSPRTGRAVCSDCARPYLDKLYKLPVNLGVTLRFLENVCVQHGVQIPGVRKMIKFV
jgi:DNA repair protein RecO (recombination protein O)